VKTWRYWFAFLSSACIKSVDVIDWHEEMLTSSKILFFARLMPSISALIQASFSSAVCAWNFTSWTCQSHTAETWPVSAIQNQHFKIRLRIKGKTIAGCGTHPFCFRKNVSGTIQPFRARLELGYPGETKWQPSSCSHPGQALSLHSRWTTPIDYRLTTNSGTLSLPNRVLL